MFTDSGGFSAHPTGMLQQYEEQKAPEAEAEVTTTENQNENPEAGSRIDTKKLLASLFLLYMGLG